ncbi:kinase-like protein [Paraphaeosphaeria sporulosa]|uniref:Kinase-like protein n=1 Tax=Paraphaeosphaeria sporulosa TaxID=1460663 RepID=A0A177CT11_9PLEO|nr:kinase-like protein [Paraphaeosphaeria sporulosa]OAG10675.1 kinase-like protein [Paraphaeosphaeria sporulosa]
MFNRLREGFRQERKMQPESESVRSVDDGGHLSRRSSSKVVPGLPRPLTFKRMSSEKREKLLEGPVSPKQRRATSLHQRRGNPPDRIKRDQDDKGNDVYNGSGRDQEEAYETSSVHSAVSTARSDLEAVLADWSGRATCDLATFLEDYEAVMDNSPEDHARGERMIALGAMGDGSEVFEISANSILKCRMGCIISAVEYLHSQNIRHKDLKPSNILLSAGRVFLTDFGTATDFSDRTSSTTEGIERGTPKYFAPEMAAYEGSGRPADIFSLGCVLLEMHTIQQKQRLHTLRDLRAKHDKSFQANHEAIVDWLARPVERESGVDRQIKDTIGWMLSKNPAERPTERP